MVYRVLRGFIASLGCPFTVFVELNRVQSVIYWSFFGLSGNGYFVFDRAPSSFIDFIGVLWGFSGFYWHLLSFLRV